MANRVVGIDIGSYAVKVVEIEGDKSTQRITALAQAVLPDGASQLGEVANADAVAQTLRTVLKKAGVVSKVAVVGVSGTRVVIRTSQLPAMASNELDAAVSYEAIELLPIPEKDLVSSYVIQGSQTGGGGESYSEVLIAGAYSKVIEAATKAIQKAGLKVQAVDVGALATQKAISWLNRIERGRTDDEKVVASSQVVVDVGSQLTEISFVDSGKVKFVRTIVRGSENITAAIKAAGDGTWEEAELAKREYSVSELDSHLDSGIEDAIKTAVSHLVGEITSTIDFYQLQSGSSNIEKVWLVGSGSRANGIAEALHERTGFEVAHPAMVAAVKESVGELSLQDESIVDYGFLTALGLALHGMFDIQSSIDLSMKRLAASRKERVKDVYGGVGVLLVAAGLSSFWYLGERQVSQLTNSVVSGQAAVSALQAQLVTLAPISKMQSTLKADEGYLAQTMQDDVAWDKVIASIGNATPTDSWMNSLQLTTATPAQAVSATASAGPSPIAVTISFNSCSQQSPIDWINSAASISGVGSTWVSSSNVNPIVEGGTGCPGFPATGTNAKQIGLGTFSSSTTLNPQLYSVPVSNYLGGGAQ